MSIFQRNKGGETGFVYNEEHDKDPRNLCYDDIAAGDYVNIPSEGSVAGYKPRTVLNQGHTASCTCHSAAHAVQQTIGTTPSPRHLYWRIKRHSKYPSSNLPYGAYLKDSLKAMIDEGGADYNLAPNEHTKSDEDYLDTFTETLKLRESAEKNKGGAYIYVTRDRGSEAIFDAVIKFIYEQKRPVQIGMSWYKEYNNARKNGIIPNTWATGSWGGHAMTAVAWKTIDSHRYMGCINSWGEYWGDNGMVWLPRTYTRFHTALAYLPPHKVEDIKIVLPKTKQKDRNLHKERANAQELRAIIDVKFPDDGTPETRTSNAVARGIGGREWLVLVNALTYKGWRFLDIVNYLYARSRGKTYTKAYDLDFEKKRKDVLN